MTTHISSYAHASSDTVKKITRFRRDQIDEHKHLSAAMNVEKNRGRGSDKFNGELPTTEHQELDPLFIALIATGKTFCFGGSITVTGNTFQGWISNS